MANTSRQTNIQIAYDEEKIEALRIFLEQKSSNVETELVTLLEGLYKRTVPLDVRNFIDARAGKPIQSQNRRNKKSENSVVDQK